MERYYWGALSAAVGLGNSKLEALVAVFGSARSAYLADRQEQSFWLPAFIKRRPLISS